MNIFIAGTNTDVGKTYISEQLMRYIKSQSLTVVGIKPVAAGAELHAGVLKNDDALRLQKQSSYDAPYAEVNPFCLQTPCSPHIAADIDHQSITVQKLPLYANPEQADVVLYEGAGGWFTPLNRSETLADWVMHHRLPVILVVGMTLGCLNHSLLTLKAIQSAQVSVLGWVANFVDKDMDFQQENLDYLAQHLDVPLLAICQYGQMLEPAEGLQAVFKTNIV